MMCFVPLALVLVGLILFGLGLHALVTGQIRLIRVSIRGLLARAIGLALILFTILCLPVALRSLVGLGMNLGH
jgi:hypothetical protein